MKLGCALGVHCWHFGDDGPLRSMFRVCCNCGKRMERKWIPVHGSFDPSHT